jgi:hypothetical protein
MLLASASRMEDKFYARAKARLERALGEWPTREQLRRRHEDAEYAFEHMSGSEREFEREYEEGEPVRRRSVHDERAMRRDGYGAAYGDGYGAGGMGGPSGSGGYGGGGQMGYGGFGRRTI